MAVGAVKYWFNGLPLDGLSTSAGAVKYWFNGLPYDTLAPAAAPSGITAVADLTQDGNTILATGTVTSGPTPTTPTQIFIEIRTAARSFTQRKRMF